jgi:hypothetical protein
MIDSAQSFRELTSALQLQAMALFVIDGQRINSEPTLLGESQRGRAVEPAAEKYHGTIQVEPSRNLLRQYLKTRLLEVMVFGESQLDPAILHDDEGNAVCKRPVLVAIAREESYRSL